MSTRGDMATWWPAMRARKKGFPPLPLPHPSEVDLTRVLLPPLRAGSTAQSFGSVPRSGSPRPGQTDQMKPRTGRTQTRVHMQYQAEYRSFQKKSQTRDPRTPTHGVSSKLLRPHVLHPLMGHVVNHQSTYLGSNPRSRFSTLATPYIEGVI